MFVRTITIALALFTSTAAAAQEATIRYRPFELASAEGRQAVANRVHAAVRQACRTGNWASTQYRCRKALSTEMLLKIGNTDVAARYNGRPVQLASRG